MFAILFCYDLFFVSCDFASGYDFTIQPNGLQIDQPPEIGNVSIVQIIIMKNDNAEGIIEFDPKYTAISGKLPWLPCQNGHTFSELQRNLNSYMHFFCLITKISLHLKKYFQLLLGSLESL